MNRLRALLGSCARDTQASAAIEMVLIMPAVLAMIAGIYDGARYVIQYQQVQIAADAGADWVRANGWSQAGAATAMSSATPTPLSATSEQLHIRCYANGTDVNAGSSCAGGGTAGDFVVLQAQMQFVPAVQWGAFGATTLQAQAIVRVP